MDPSPRPTNESPPAGPPPPPWERFVADRLSRVSATDLRLLRRIVRDRHQRGYKAAENIARWIWEALEAKLPGLCEVRLYEIPDSCVTYRGRG